MSIKHKRKLEEKKKRMPFLTKFVNSCLQRLILLPKHEVELTWNQS